jgi:aminoglycoside phosphotransferase family enzyme
VASGITAREKCEFLADPGHYPDRPRAVEVVETHFAWVFLTDRYVYKMKKAGGGPPWTTARSATANAAA